MSLVLAVGRRYVRRDGEIVGPLLERDANPFRFLDPERLYSYTPKGRYLDSGNDSHLDLVREYASKLSQAKTRVLPVWA